MPNKLFNEVEVYVLKKWPDARLLERSLEKMREKYRGVLEKVLAEVRKKHGALDRSGVELRIDEDDDAQRGVINIGVGKKDWPSRSPQKYPSGLWLSGISLGELIAEREPAPTANISLMPAAESNWDLKVLASKLEEEARQIAPQLNAYAESDPAAGWGGIGYVLTESRKELRQLLLKEESRPFINCLVAHFDKMAKFIPVIDKLFRPAKRSAK